MTARGTAGPAGFLALSATHLTASPPTMMVSIGLTTSALAAVRALGSVGIQRGHMALHARSVAVAAGAEGEFVERVAAMIVEARDITLEAAKRALAAISRQAVGATALDD